MDGQCRQLPIQVLADQVILIRPEMADCPPIVLRVHPALGRFLRP